MIQWQTWRKRKRFLIKAWVRGLHFGSYSCIKIDRNIAHYYMITFSSFVSSSPSGTFSASTSLSVLGRRKWSGITTGRRFFFCNGFFLNFLINSFLQLPYFSTPVSYCTLANCMDFSISWWWNYSLSLFLFGMRLMIFFHFSLAFFSNDCYIKYSRIIHRKSDKGCIKM